MIIGIVSGLKIIVLYLRLSGNLQCLCFLYVPTTDPFDLNHNLGAGLSRRSMPCFSPAIFTCHEVICVTDYFECFASRDSCWRHVAVV